jgi:hypothetical protein
MKLLQCDLQLSLMSLLVFSFVAARPAGADTASLHSYADMIIIKANLSTQTDTTTTWNRKTVEESFTQEIAVLLPHYLDGVMQLGYSSERIIFWANFNFSLNWYNQLRLYTAENDQIYGLLYFGYRFDAPGFAGKTMDWLYGKQP